MDIWLGGPIHPKRISRYQAIQSASNGANQMTRLIIPALVALLVSGPAGAKKHDRFYIDLAKISSQLFICSILAEMSDNNKEQNRLFQLGYKSG